MLLLISLNIIILIIIIIYYLSILIIIIINCTTINYIFIYMNYGILPSPPIMN